MFDFSSRELLLSVEFVRFTAQQFSGDITAWFDSSYDTDRLVDGGTCIGVRMYRGLALPTPLCCDFIPDDNFGERATEILAEKGELVEPDIDAVSGMAGAACSLGEREMQPIVFA